MWQDELRDVTCNLNFKNRAISRRRNDHFVEFLMSKREGEKERLFVGVIHLFYHYSNISVYKGHESFRSYIGRVSYARIVMSDRSKSRMYFVNFGGAWARNRVNTLETSGFESARACKQKRAWMSMNERGRSENGQHWRINCVDTPTKCGFFHLEGKFESDCD